jgi:hypothetical protein
MQQEDGMVHAHKERGQALVLIILAIVGILGFAALALDFGRYFLERRRAQNAADAAAYAAAYAGATVAGNFWQNAGVNSAQLNGFNDLDWGTNATAEVDVQVHHPPIRGRYAVATDTINPNEYYQVIIRQKVDQIFSQFVYSGGLWVETEAVARSTTKMSFGGGGTMVACCPNCCDAITATGGGIINILNGNLMSSSIVSNDPLDGGLCHSVKITNNTTLNILNGDVFAAGSVYKGNQLTFEFDIFQNTAVPDSCSYPYTPLCAGLPTNPPVTSPEKDKDLYVPGIYSSISIDGAKKVTTLSPGMYCLDGDFTVNSGSLTGADVMIVMRSGSLKIITKQPVILEAPTGTGIEGDGTNPTWSGFLVFMPADNKSIVYLGGGGTTTYTGTVFAPGELDPNPFTIPDHGTYDKKCVIQGSQTEKTTLNSSIICYSIRVAGANELNIQNESKNNAIQPGSIELPE